MTSRLFPVIRATTAIYGIIGDPIEHSLSPLMHNAAIADMGIDAVYVAFHVLPDNLEKAVRGLSALGVSGFNVTVPHKTRIIPLLDSISKEAKAVGAVNTVIIRDGVLHGDNSDVFGFMRSLSREGGLMTLPEKVAVIGAGGAARGVVFGCAKRPEVKEVALINRTLSKAESLAKELSQATGKVITAHPATENVFRRIVTSSGLVINTSSVGMYPKIDATPVPDSRVFHEGQLVCDIIYRPSVTRFLSEAQKRGAHTVGGLGMLAYQGARSLALWTGRKAPAQVMLNVLDEYFRNEKQ